MSGSTGEPTREIMKEVVKKKLLRVIIKEVAFFQFLTVFENGLKKRFLILVYKITYSRREDGQGNNFVK